MSAFSLTLSVLAVLIGIAGWSQPGGAYWMDKELTICLAILLALVGLVLSFFSKKRKTMLVAAAVFALSLAPVIYGTLQDNRTWSVQVFNQSKATIDFQRLDGMPLGKINAKKLAAGESSELAIEGMVTVPDAMTVVWDGKEEKLAIPKKPSSDRFWMLSLSFDGKWGASWSSLR